MFLRTKASKKAGVMVLEDTDGQRSYDDKATNAACSSAISTTAFCSSISMHIICFYFIYVV
jgi:hypothetical protein